MGCGSSSTTAQEPQSVPKDVQPQVTGHNDDLVVSSAIDISTSHNDVTSDPESTKKQWSEFELESLRAHNQFRGLHGVAVLALDHELCSIAQRYADKLAAQQKFEHSTTESSQYHGAPSGENLASSSSTDHSHVPPALNAVRGWYDEINEYDYKNPGFAMGTGHFTQVVWEDTRLVGVGRASYTHGQWKTYVTVANYVPPGNCLGKFAEKVPAPHIAG